MAKEVKERLHKGYAQVMEMAGAPLADEKSRYQRIKIFDTVANGRVMTLDDIVQITTRDESTVELLGEDYPYYCEPERGSILAAIERARSSFGSPERQQGLERMRQVRELTSMGSVLDDYEALLRRLTRERDS